MIRNEVVIDEKFIRENMNYFGHESDLNQRKKIKNMKIVRKAWEKFVLKLFHEYINKKIFIYTDDQEIQTSNNYIPGTRIIKWSSIESYDKTGYYLRLYSDIQGHKIDVCYDMRNFKANDLEELLLIIERNNVRLLS